LHNGKKEIISRDKNEIGVMNITPEGHRDIDELIEVMEWTRQRVGPGGLIIIHNTMAPMFVTENFANYVVSMEWGYGKLIKDVPPLAEIPPEWNFAGARPRGVIGNGTMHPDAPAELKAKLALEALLTGVTPWPIMQEAISMHKVLLPLGDLNQYKFEDWRNKSVTLDDTLCASAVYSKPHTAFVIIGNLRKKSSNVTVHIITSALPFPIADVTSVKLLDNSGGSELSKNIINMKGEKITIAPSGEVLIKITGKK
jgi:hypothetical protein